MFFLKENYGRGFMKHRRKREIVKIQQFFFTEKFIVAQTDLQATVIPL